MAKTRKEVLEELDEKPLGWTHVKAVLVSGVGFYTDAYDLFIIGIVVSMMGPVYWPEKDKAPKLDATFIKGTATVGTLLGQLLFGFLGDVLGRKKIYGVELAIMITSTIMSAFAASAVRGFNVTMFICFWRFWLGFGIGGDYPLSATITAEFASKKHRGKLMAAVFAMQGLGILSAGLTALTILSIYQDPINQDKANVDYVWRWCLGLGIVPALFAVYFRTKISETPRFTIDVDGNEAKAAADIQAEDEGYDPTENENEEKLKNDPSKSKRITFAEFRAHFGQWKNGKVLFGTSAAWFFLDIAWYGLGLNQDFILKEIGYSCDKCSTYDKLHTSATGQVLLALMGTVPGYWVTVGLVDYVGRKPIQLFGFAALTVIFVVITAGFYKIKEQAVGLFVFLFAAAQFFFNFGPNTTTFIVPGEVFPTRFRSTGHGIAAASGKLGAIIAAYGFDWIADSGSSEDGTRTVMAIFSVVMFLGFLVTFLIPETKGLSLEELADEDGDGAVEMQSKANILL